MADKFQLFRLSLLQRAQRDAFAGPDVSRYDYLTEVFSRQHIFKHFASEFHFRPDGSQSRANALLARLGRKTTSDENRPPDEELEEISRESWKAVVIVVDPSDTKDGQKVAVEIDRAVGQPDALIAGLVKRINQSNPLSPYTIEVEPIIDAQDFWAFAEANRGKVTSLTFEFVVPNGLWNANTSIKEELRAARAIGAERVSETFKTKGFIDTDNEKIKEAVDYVSNGSGKIRGKSKSGQRFNSTESPNTSEIDNVAIDSKETMIRRVARQIEKVLRRE